MTFQGNVLPLLNNNEPGFTFYVDVPPYFSAGIFKGMIKFSISYPKLTTSSVQIYIASLDYIYLLSPNYLVHIIPWFFFCGFPVIFSLVDHAPLHHFFSFFLSTGCENWSPFVFWGTWKSGEFYRTTLKQRFFGQKGSWQRANFHGDVEKEFNNCILFTGLCLCLCYKSM